MHETKIIARYSETDQMGVIYHANYFPWFEVARAELFAKTETTYQELEIKGVMLPVIEVGCKYKASAKYADHLLIRSRVETLSPVRFKIAYQVVREADQVLIAEGFTEHVFLDCETRKPINFKKKFAALYEGLEALK